MAHRNVVFVGNCQARALAEYYQACLADPMDERVSWVKSGVKLTPINRKKLARADTVALQVRDFESKIQPIDERHFRPGTKIVRFPGVMVRFLWPFAGVPHPKNQSYPFYQTGPFPPRLGDAFLNKLMAKGSSVEEAYEQYLSLDFQKVTNLDRLYELTISSQSSRDEKTGMSVAPAIERHFRIEPIFQDFGHFTMPIFRALAPQVYAALGASEAAIEKALANRVRPIFPTAQASTHLVPMTCTPIHPGVARHFGLPYASENTKYCVGVGDPVTFAEFVLRYLRYEWNPDLHEAVWLARRGDDSDHALELLNRGLKISPKAGLGHLARSTVLRRKGRYAEALMAARIAAELDPQNPDILLILAQLAADQGEHANAQTQASRLVQSVPDMATAHLALAQIHRDAGNLAVAIAAASRLIEIYPGNGRGQHMLGKLLLEGRNLSGAETALRRAAALGIKTHQALAEVFASQGRLDEALDQTINGLVMAPRNPQLRAKLIEYANRHGPARGLQQSAIGDRPAAE